MSTIKSLLSKYLFPNTPDYQGLHQKIVEILATEVEIDRLMQVVLSTILTNLKINNGALVVLKDGLVGRIEFVGYPSQVPFSGSDLSWLLTQSKPSLTAKDIDNPLEKNFFETKNLSIIVSLGPKEERIGYLLLGPIKEGLGQAKTFFDNLAPQMTIALKNAESRRQIQEFNATLAGRVAERTRQLEESQATALRLKDEFVFIATHDLATPVTAISGFTSLINARAEPVSDELKNNLKAITIASDRLKTLVNDLLEVARSDSGTIKVEVNSTDLNPVIKETVATLDPLASNNNVSVKLDLAPESLIMGDKKKLAEILENLLSNAIKYNKPGGVVTIKTTKLGDAYELSIQDTGIGIPLSEQPKVFSKFFRSDEAEVRALPGTGLGLFVVRMLCEKMGGTIRFESKPGIGTIFRLNFRIS